MKVTFPPGVQRFQGPSGKTYEAPDGGAIDMSAWDAGAAMSNYGFSPADDEATALQQGGQQ